NLEHTSNLPITLKSRKYYEERYNFRSLKEQGHLTLNILRNKGWQCENVFFFFKPTRVFNEKYIDILSTWIQLNNKFYLEDRSSNRSSAIEWGTESIWFLIVSNLKKEEFSTLPTSMWDIMNVEENAIQKLLTVNLFLLFLPDGNSSFSLCSLYTLHSWNLRCLQTLNIEYVLGNEFLKLGTDNIWNIEDSKLHKSPLSSDANVDATVDGYIFKNILEKKMNGSILTTGCGNYGHCAYSKFMMARPLKEYGGIKDAIFLKAEGLNFLSCYRVTYIKFYLYFSPFSAKIWVSILVVLVASGIFMDIVCHLKQIEMRNSILLIFLGFLIDEASFIPRKLWNRYFAKMVIVPWLLFGTILSNLYLGKLIDDVNSPLAGKSLNFLNETRIEGDEELDMDDLYQRQSRFYSQDAHLQDWEEKSFSILSAPYKGFWDKFSKAESYNLQNILMREYKSALFDVGGVRKLYFYLLNPYSRWLPILYDSQSWEDVTAEDVQELIEEELIECGKSVYVDYSKEVVANRSYLKRRYPNINFYLGKEKFFEKSYGLIFEINVAKSKVPTYFKMFFESGIYIMLNSLADYNLYNQKKIISSRIIANRQELGNEETFSPLKIENSIQTLFLDKHLIQSVQPGLASLTDFDHTPIPQFISHCTSYIQLASTLSTTYKTSHPRRSRPSSCSPSMPRSLQSPLPP
ncbi:hypothetical protein Fcan01_22140, partial [Folsomia candida]